MNSVRPLHYPSPWPPPDYPQRTESKSALERVPVVGGLIGWWRERRRRLLHLSTVLLPVERQIAAQLVARSGSAFWADSPSQQRVAGLMATAVAEEKGLPSITLHPDDPVELLFWGAEDDMSSLRFALRLRKEWGVILSAEDMAGFFRNRLTVSEVVELCLAKHAGASKGA